MTTKNDLPVIIAGINSLPLATNIAKELGSRVIRTSNKRFDDREIKTTIEENVRDRNVVVVASASGNPDEQEKETRLLLRAAGKRGGAKSVTLLVPYMWYGRSDDTWGERTEPALIDTIETLRSLCDNVIVADPHNASIVSAKFLDASSPVRNCHTIQFSYPYAVQLKTMMEQGLIGKDSLMLAHADAGSVKRISPTFRACVYNTLGLKDRKPEQDDWAVGMKDRDKVTGKSRFKGFSDSAQGMDVVIFEDMIASGGTAVELADILKKQGARSVTLFATSGLFTTKADNADKLAAVTRINASQLDHVFVTDTYDHSATNPAMHKAIQESPVIHVIETAPLLAGIVNALYAKPRSDRHDHNSVSAILRGEHSQQKKMARPTAMKPKAFGA